ncbi:unnamed protein product [Absidia cylindrospora]
MVLPKANTMFFHDQNNARGFIFPQGKDSTKKVQLLTFCLFRTLINSRSKVEQASIEANIDNTLPDLDVPDYSKNTSSPPTQDLPYAPSTYIFSSTPASLPSPAIPTMKTS